MSLLKLLPAVFVTILLLSFGASLAQSAGHNSGEGWWSARRDSAGMAPDPRQHASTAIVQVYAAQTYGWKGWFAVHPWIVYKRAGETRYHRYEVISWGSDDKVRHNQNIADAYWYGARPRLLVEHRGAAAAAMIPRIEAAINDYPWPQTYHAWPGPNSNTFLAHIGREVPELKLNLPANAIGKDFRSLLNPVGLPPSGKGVQLSLLGVAGVTLGGQEGLEVNVLGLNLGMAFDPPALRLPFVGQLDTGEAHTAKSDD